MTPERRERINAAQRRRYAALTPEERAAKNLRYRASTEARKQARRRYYFKHREKCLSYERDRRKANPEREAAKRKAYNERAQERIAEYYSRPQTKAYFAGRHLAKTYGLTLERLQEMLSAQDGKCPICGRALHARPGEKGQGRAVVDHNHATGEVRGLLCAACNGWLGRLEQPGYLDRANAYLAKFSR